MPGAQVHALAHQVMGPHAAMKIMYGNVNYRKTYISGNVVRVFDSRKPNAKAAQWSLRVRWDIPGRSGEEGNILRQHTTYGPIPQGANPTSIAFADSLNVRDSQAVRGSTTYMPDAMGVALDSPADASQQVQLTGGGNLGTQAAGTGDTTGVVMEERTSGENTITPSNRSDTPNASTTGPPLAAAANATTVSTAAPDGAPATAASSQQQSRRRSSGGRQQQQPHDLVNNPITVEHASGSKHNVVAMNPNPDGREWVVADNDCVQGDITGGPPVISWYQKGPLGDKVCPNNPQFNGDTRKMSRLEALLLMWPPQHLELVLELTNKNLTAAGKPEMTKQELVKWLGLCLLITRVRETRSGVVTPTELDSVEEDNANTNLPTLRPTIKTKSQSQANKDGAPKLAQGRCQGKECKSQSTRVCSKCTHPTDATQKQYFYCDPCKCKGKCNAWNDHLEWHRQNDA